MTGQNMEIIRGDITKVEADAAVSAVRCVRTWLSASIDI